VHQSLHATSAHDAHSGADHRFDIPRSEYRSIFEFFAVWFLYLKDPSRLQTRSRRMRRDATDHYLPDGLV